MPRLVLLSPYGGGNLGDAAILKAVQQNLGTLLPAAEIRAVTLNVAATERTHGLKGTQTFVRSRAYYGAGADDPEPVRVPFWKAVLKRIRNVLSLVSKELAHWRHCIKFLRGTDVLIFAGGGQFDEEFGGAWGHPYAMLKWATAARLTGTRVLFMSVGICHLDSPISRRLSRHALRRAHYVSFRDAWSQSEARAISGRDDIALVPDLAFSLLDAVPEAYPPVAPGTLTIGISPIAYGRPDLWPRRNHDVFNGYFAALCEATYILLTRGHSVVLFSTDTPDRLIVDAMVEQLRARCSSTELGRLTVKAPESVQALLPVIDSTDMVIASRLHGAIISHTRDKPVLAISYDRKVTAHMAEFDQAEWCLELVGLQVGELLERFDSMLPQMRQICAHVHATRQRWRTSVAAQYRMLETIAPDCFAPAALAHDSER